MENRDNVKEKGNGATDVLGALVKQLRTMWIAIFVLLAILFITNSIWIYVFQSYGLCHTGPRDRITLTVKSEVMYIMGQKVRGRKGKEKGELRRKERAVV